MNSLIESFRSNERLSNLIAELFVAAMMACLGVTALSLGQRLQPGWQGGFLPWVCFIVSLEAIFSQRRLRRTADLDTPVIVYRLVELVVVMVGLKAAIYAWQGFERLQADLPLWWGDFFGTFLDAQYLLSLLVVLLVWMVSTNYADDLVSLEGDELILQAESLDQASSNRGTTQQRLANRIFGVGVGMVFCMALVRMDLTALYGGTPPAKGGMLHVLVYFLLGLALLSLAQLSVRRAAWAWQHLPVSDGMARRWVLYSLLFLGVILLLAFILPTRYTIGLLPTLSYVFSVVFMAVYTLIMLILLPVFYLFSWIMSLFGGTAVNTPDITAVQQFFPQNPAPVTAAPAPWLEVLRSIVFWVLVVGVVVYAFYTYFRQNRELTRKLRRLPGMAWLVKAWRWLTERVRTGVGLVPQAVQAGLRRLDGLRRKRPLPEGRQFLSLRRLTPRQRVLFYYLALVRRGSERGLPRKPWQTPYEYSQQIEAQLADGGGEVDDALKAMTDAFVDARYSQHPVEDVHASAVQRYWEKIRSALRALKG